MRKAPSNLYFDAETIERLEQLQPLYPKGKSACVSAAVALLWRQHFAPTSEAPDAVLELVRKQLRMALAGVEGELERRAEAEARDD
jgi:negative regulator of sigma E activity